MSRVTNVMLCLPTAARDQETVKQLSDWLAESTRFKERLLRLPGEPWGGSKQPEAVIFAAALWNFDTGELVEHIGSAPWTWPHTVQLMIRDQDDASFAVWMFRDGVFTQVLAATTLG